MPPRRQPHDDEAGVAARLEHPVLARLGQQRLGRDAQDALDGESTVREQTARVALPLLRHGGRTNQPERHAVRLREPRAELDGRPVVLAAAERDEHGALGRLASGDDQCDVAGGLLEERGELLVGSSLYKELVGSLRDEEIDVELGGEAGQVARRARST